MLSRILLAALAIFALVPAAAGQERIKPPGLHQPQSIFHLYVQHSGDDSAECFEATPCRTLEGVLGFALRRLDFADQGAAIIHLACEEFAGVHFSAHAFVGSQGGQTVTIRGCGPGKTIINGSVELYFVHGLHLQNMSMKSASSCLTVNKDAYVYFGNIEFLDCKFTDVGLGYGGKVELSDNYSKAGNSEYHVVAQDAGTLFHSRGFRLTIGADLSFHTFVAAEQLSEVVFGGSKIDMGDHVAKGRKFLGRNNAVIISGDNNRDFFPGDVPGHLVNGAVYE